MKIQKPLSNENRRFDDAISLQRCFGEQRTQAWKNEDNLGRARGEYWLLAPQEDGGIVKIIVLDIQRETGVK